MGKREEKGRISKRQQLPIAAGCARHLDGRSERETKQNGNCVEHVGLGSSVTTLEPFFSSLFFFRRLGHSPAQDEAREGRGCQEGGGKKRKEKEKETSAGSIILVGSLLDGAPGKRQ